MSKIKQFKLIEKAFEMKKDKHIKDLMQINDLINRKMMVLTQVKNYRSEYENHDDTRAYKNIPSLAVNWMCFVKKIDEMIIKENQEMIRLEKIKISILTKLSECQNKINYFVNRIDGMIFSEQQKEDKLEQVRISDIATSKIIRSDKE